MTNRRKKQLRQSADEYYRMIGSWLNYPRKKKKWIKKQLYELYYNLDRDIGIKSFSYLSPLGYRMASTEEINDMFDGQTKYNE